MAHNTEVPKRIHLRGEPVFEEATAGGIIRPGMLVAQNAIGKVIPHSTAAAVAEKAFAVEDGLQGKTIDNSYASGDKAFFAICKPGDIVYALLAGGEIATRNEYLESNGDGMLKVGTTYPVAIALEDVDASDTASVDERIKVRIL